MIMRRLSKTYSIATILVCAMLPMAFFVSNAQACYSWGIPLDVEVDVGSIHFAGEMVEFYILVSYKGEPVDADISATLYYNKTVFAHLNASVENIVTGLYRIPYIVATDASAGTYALVVNASFCTLRGTSLKTFLLSSTLTNWNASIIEIRGNIAIIKTDIGAIKVSLEAINAKLVRIEGDIATINTTLGDIQGTIVSIQEEFITIKTDIGHIQIEIGAINTILQNINGTLVTIQSDIGEIQVSLSQINATLVALNTTTAMIQTNIGTIRTSIEDIQLKISNVEGNLTTLSTVFGDIQGTLVSIQDDIFTIKTDLGEIEVSQPPTPATTLGIPIAATLAAIAAIASIISTIILLRKRQ